MYDAFLGVGGVGVRLTAGSQNAVVGPRLASVNKSIVDDREHFVGGFGTAADAHDWIVFPGYPTSYTAADAATYAPVCEMSFCSELMPIPATWNTTFAAAGLCLTLASIAAVIIYLKLYGHGPERATEPLVARE